jgi:hypothetical protein
LRPQQRVYGPFFFFFFMGTTITGIVYLDMLQQFLIPQLDVGDQEGRIHFQQDGSTPHYLGEVLEYSAPVSQVGVYNVQQLLCPSRSLCRRLNTNTVRI